ncbi:MAG: flagellar basal body L-ring protein FlgH [Alphaproteobacteria bacterium]|nr:flagellar basal body L-ring protein FlgH [Alphaproteobacteria bacterium]
MGKNIYKLIGVTAAVSVLCGCNALTRLSEVGSAPAISPIENPTTQAGYQPVEMPMPEAQIASPNPNSLWRQGSRGFFKDQRASRVGDILTVQIIMEDKALLENKSEQKRGDDKDTTSINALAGLETYAGKFLPSGVNPANLIDITSKRDLSGEGTIDRNEKIEVTMAAIITQVLPNGNLVITGKQQVRVNYELRELVMSGIIRREDISSSNNVTSDKIAELRVAYGGRGTISDVQQPRYGRQILDIINPF